MTSPQDTHGGRPAEDAAPAPLIDDDAEPDLADIRWVDAGAMLVFWVLAFVVFLQFFSRYVLNDSIGWTEEIARYLLICTGFTGAVIAVRKDSHIVVEFFYRWLPRGARRVLSGAVDIGKVVFFAAATWITVDLAQRTKQKMASIEVSKAVIYWIVAACFLAMTVYAARLAWERLRGPGGPLVQGPDTGDEAPTRAGID
ncbi:MAG: TRAP transporter small permease [Pseudomonadota bacterium]